jgi:hypothetical protein
MVLAVVCLYYTINNVYVSLTDCETGTGIIYFRWVVMLSQIVMTVMMHTILQPEVKSGLDMMKFSVNHPERFQSNHWYLGFLAGFGKASSSLSIQMLCVTSVLNQCDVINVILSYIRYYALAFGDNYYANSMGSGAPFIDKMGGNALLQIDRTSSLKNIWASAEYTETLSMKEENAGEKKEKKLQEDSVLISDDIFGLG